MQTRQGRAGWADRDRENVTDDFDDYFDAVVLDHSIRQLMNSYFVVIVSVFSLDF